MRYVPTKAAPSLKEAMDLVFLTCISNSDDLTWKEKIERLNGSRFDVDNYCNEQPAISNYNKYLGISTLISQEDINVDRIWNYIEKLYELDKKSKIKPKNPLKYPSTEITKKRKETEISIDNTGLAGYIHTKDNYLKDWYNNKTRIHGNSRYKLAAYFSFAIIDRKDSVSKDYITRFYDTFGLNEVEDVNLVYDSAYLLGWLDDLILLVTYVLLRAEEDEKWILDKLQLLESFVDEHMKPVNMAAAVENHWLADVSSFSPRSFDDEGLSMQDFYVQPVFESQSSICEEPLKRLSDNLSSSSLIISPTGMGKSMYMRMAALRLLSRDMKTGDVLPNDKYVIYVPAYMFSYCYRKQNYKEWTGDLVRLYFNCMFRLAPSINFDKHKKREEKLQVCPVDLDCGEFNYDNEKPLKDYISALAKCGRLVLLADSFDEIVSGEMRQAYLHAINKFKDNYCDYPEEIGAHVIVTSREMGHATMNALASSLGISFSSSDTYRLKPLSLDQQTELILNWDRAFGKGIKEYIGILDNHYFAKLCENPYMLSITCRSDGKKINEIINDLITKLLQIYTNESAASMLDEKELRVLGETTSMKKKLQNIAVEAIKNSPPRFSKDLLEEQFLNEIKKMGLSNDAFDRYRDTILGFFTISVGLIVPADKEDDGWQFISTQFAYELAADRIIGDAPKSELTTNQYYENVLSNYNNKTLISLMVPLICKLHSSHRYDIEEELIKYIALNDFKEDDPSAIEMMIDLILQRYGPNITGLIPNEKTHGYTYIVNADRLILMRLLSSPNFVPNDSEKKAIKEANAYKACSGFLSEHQHSLLQY